MKRKALKKLTAKDIDAYVHVFVLEYGGHEKLFRQSLKFCQDLLRKTGISIDVRAYIADIASRVS